MSLLIGVLVVATALGVMYWLLKRNSGSTAGPIVPPLPSSETFLEKLRRKLGETFGV